MINVAIIGGGISGLQCARTLHQQGINFQLYESQNEFGGRIAIEKLGEHTLEMGAQFIHGNINNPVVSFAAENSISAKERPAWDDIHPSIIWKTIDGKVIESELVGKMVDLFKTCLDEVTTEDYISATNLLEEDIKNSIFAKLSSPEYADLDHSKCKEILDVQFHLAENIEGVDSLSQLEMALYDDDFEEGNMAYFLNGYYPIINAIIKTIPKDSLNLQCIVKEVVKLADSVMLTIQTSEGCMQKEFDYVVVTCSLGMLKNNEISFKPELPDHLQHAIKNLGFGILEKIFLVFDQPVIEVSCKNIIFTRAGRKMCEKPENWEENLCFLTRGDEDGCVIVAWMNGTAAYNMGLKSDQEVKEKVTKICKKVLDCENASVINFTRSWWAHNKHTRGSYSHLAAGATQNLTKNFTVPVSSEHGKPLIMFAGEHTHASQFATTHGAFISGTREANRIIQQAQAAPNSKQ